MLWNGLAFLVEFHPIESRVSRIVSQIDIEAGRDLVSVGANVSYSMQFVASQDDSYRSTTL